MATAGGKTAAREIAEQIKQLETFILARAAKL